MVAQSIIQIDVLDDSFEAFQARFLKYQEQVTKQPEAWKRIGSSIKSTDNEFVKLGKTVAETVKAVQYAAGRQEAFRAAAAGTAKTFVGMAKSSKQLVGHLKDGAAVLLKWSGMIGLMSGIVGAGGLFGIARLAASASQNRRESQGLGVSGGELQAAQINYQKIFNVDELLGRINEARNDVTKRWAFNAAGLQPGQMEGKSNAEVLTMLAPLLKSTFEKSGGTQQAAQAHGLLEFVDMSTLTRLKAVTQAELDTTEKAYRSSLVQLTISDNVNRSWQELEITFKNSGSVIEKMFKEKLVGLAGPLEHLSEAFTKAVKVFLDSPKIEKWITAVADGLEDLSKYLVSDELGKDINSALDSLDEFGGALVVAARFMGKVFNIGAEKSLKASEYRQLDELKKIDPKLAETTKYRLENPEASVEKGDKFDPHSGFALKRNREVWNEAAQAAISGKDGARVKEILDSLKVSTATQSASGKIKPIAAPQASPVKKLLAQPEATKATKQDSKKDVGDVSRPDKNDAQKDVRESPETAPAKKLQRQEAEMKEATKNPRQYSDEQKQFLISIKPWAEEAAAKLGVSPEIVSAHAALESGWGKRPLRNGGAGPDSNNLFGLKATGDWRGDVATAMTTEYEGGEPQKKTQRFRSYPDTASAFRDYASLLTDNPRYKAALNTGSDASAFASGLQKGGYATDPEYANKLSKLAASIQASATAAPIFEATGKKTQEKEPAPKIESSTKDNMPPALQKTENMDKSQVFNETNINYRDSAKKEATSFAGNNSASDGIRDYVRGMMQSMDRMASTSQKIQPAQRQIVGVPATIRIENSTGGNAIVIGSQIA
jgi:flagellar protein FlgJ